MNICILGTVGAGKSTAAQIVARHFGAVVFESDELAHEAYPIDSPGYKKLVGHFGPDVVAADGTIDRGALGKIVFNDDAARLFLKGVVDPFVRSEIRRLFIDGEALGPEKHRVLASYLMVERHWFPEAFHHAIVVISDRDSCVRRLTVQRKWSEKYAGQVLDTQMSSDEILDEARKLFGTRVTVVANDSDVERLEARLLDLFGSIIETTSDKSKELWASFLENESNHLLSIFINEEQRASWLLTLSGALLAALVANPPAAGQSGPLALFISSIALLGVSIAACLLAVYPIDGSRRLFSDFLGGKHAAERELPIEEFLRVRARPGHWSASDYLTRVKYHYRSHWLIAQRKKKFVAWACILTFVSAVASTAYFLVTGW